MKKLLSIVFISALFFSCSTDNNEVINNSEEQTAQADLETLVAQGNYDNSQFGIYKGVFTTLDGQNRATVKIEWMEKNEPTVTFEFPTGEKAQMKASSVASKSQEGTSATTFTGKDFSFDFNINNDGSNPVISNVTYMGAKGDIIVLKETSKAAIQAKTGTYSCTVCNHPELGTGETQTFNTIATSQAGMDNGATFDIQATLGSKVYYGNMSQSNCSATRGLTTCDLTGTITANSGPVTVTGTHLYDSSGGTYPDCSDLQGTWVYDSTIFGKSTLSFQSDDPDNCNIL